MENIEISVEDLKCIICKDPYYEPILTICGHHFCKKCIIDWFEINRSYDCPKCKIQFPVTFTANYVRNMNQDYFLSNLVKSHFKEKCKNHNYGCKETFLPQELEEHYTKCSYEFIECPNYDKGCYSKILRKDIYKHKKECYFNSCPGFRY